MGFSTTAAIIMAGASLGASVYQGQMSAKSQKRSLESQEQAQKQAIAQQNAQRRESQEAMAKANRKTPDIATIMAQAMEPSKGGAASTMLSGGVDPLSLQLGRNTLLGQ